MKKYKNISIEEIKNIAKQIYLDFDESENEFFLKEFNVFLQQLELFSNDNDIDNFKPADFPFEIKNNFYLRDDVVKNIEKTEDILKNAKNKLAGQIKIPKVTNE